MKAITTLPARGSRKGLILDALKSGPKNVFLLQWVLRSYATHGRAHFPPAPSIRRSLQELRAAGYSISEANRRGFYRWTPKPVHGVPS